MNDKLANEVCLRQWIDSLGLGKIEAIVINNPGGYNIYQLLREHERIIRKLEKAYMNWAENIYIHLTKDYVYRIPILRSPSNVRIKLHNVAMDLDLKNKYSRDIQRLRPIHIHSLKKGNVLSDKISFLSNIEQDLVQKLHVEREKDAIQEENKRCPTFFGNRSVSAFITFKSEKSCTIAKQLLIHSELENFSPRICQAPPLNQVVWNNLTIPDIERKLRNYCISFFGVLLPVFWTFPTSFIAGFTNLGALALNPTFTGYVQFLIERPVLYTFVNTFGAPIIIQTANLLSPYLFECTCTIISRFIKPAGIRISWKYGACNAWEIFQFLVAQCSPCISLLQHNLGLIIKFFH